MLVADSKGSRCRGFRGWRMTLATIAAALVSMAMPTASTARAQVASAGKTLTRTESPGRRYDTMTSPALDLQGEWKAWKDPGWECEVARASGGTPVIFCIWEPGRWVTEPYGTYPPELTIPPAGSFTARLRLSGLRRVALTDVAVPSRHGGPVQGSAVQ